MRVRIGHWQTDEHTEALIRQVLDSGRITYGPLSRRLERVVSKLHGCKFGVLSNSGTSSLLTAVQALKGLRRWGDGAEVIVPATTFIATLSVLVHNRLKPVLVDVEEDTYNLNPDEAAAAVNRHTVAILPVHLFGQPARMEAIAELADRHNLAVIEDSCETMFVKRIGTPVGGWGDVGCFSFYISHLITAGVGGMAVTNNPDLASRMRSLVNHGWVRKQRPVDVESFDLREAQTRYWFTAWGHSFRITEFEAALALAQLENWEAILNRRQQVATWYKEILSPLREFLILPFEAEAGEHAYMMYPLVLTDRGFDRAGGDKWQLVQFLEERGIETREMLPLVNQPIVQQLAGGRRFPVSKRLITCGFYIGCHPHISREDVEYVGEIFTEFFE